MDFGVILVCEAIFGNVMDSCSCSCSRRRVRVRNKRWVRHRIFFFNKITTKAIGVGTRRAADPLWTGMRTRGLAHPAAPDSLLRF
jgi:hypothetical protein